jgi:hypothetical protein
MSLTPANEHVKNKITLSSIVKLEQYFSCSRQGILFRLKEIGLIDYQKYIQYTENVKQSARFLGYDGDLYEPGNTGLVIGNYGSKAKSLYDEEKISESHFISLMNDIGIDISSIVNTDEQD